MEEAVKAMQAGDVATAEKELLVLVKERDPRAQYFCSASIIYGNPDSKLYDPNKATPMLLDAAERGYVPAMLPIAGAYAEGKGVPKSCSKPTSGWRSPSAGMDRSRRRPTISSRAT